ncbi:unnamed protein product [Coregonus sp. 'balchen']|nr:unnamed protein product [Coregonus sp. 'balchen']
MQLVINLTNFLSVGNWWGHAPYKHGTPCSACPPSYGGGCKDNLCYKDEGTESQRPQEETEENNSIEPEAPQSPQKPRARSPQPKLPPLAQTPTPPTTPTTRGAGEEQAQLVTCDTKLRDQCKGTTCNRYECPAGCLDSTGKQSSICRAGIHSGVVDKDGGWLDVTRQGRKDFFIKSNKNGIQSLGLYCPRNCMEENPNISRVIGTRIYSDVSDSAQRQIWCVLRISDVS